MVRFDSSLAPASYRGNRRFQGHTATAEIPATKTQPLDSKQPAIPGNNGNTTLLSVICRQPAHHINPRLSRHRTAP